MNSNNITVTDGRFKKALQDNIEPIMIPRVKKNITKAVNNSKIRTGVITKFFPYIDKAEVKLDTGNKKIICKILHRFGGEILDLYTPTVETKGYSKKLKEPFIVPRVKQNVCVLNIHDKDSDEHLILGYYQNEDLVGINPASPGNIKLSAMGVTNDYYIKFGLDGLSYKLPQKLSGTVGYFENEMEKIEFSNADNVYTKEEVYTKAEVDQLLEDLKKELIEGINNDAAG